MFQLSVNYKVRRKVQEVKLGLPTLRLQLWLFPQSPEVRRTRLAWKRGDISDTEYEDFIKSEIARWIKIQEDLDLDVLRTVNLNVWIWWNFSVNWLIHHNKTWLGSIVWFRALNRRLFMVM